MIEILKAHGNGQTDHQCRTLTGKLYQSNDLSIVHAYM